LLTKADPDDSFSSPEEQCTTNFISLSCTSAEIYALANMVSVNLGSKVLSVRRTSLKASSSREREINKRDGLVASWTGSSPLLPLREGMIPPPLPHKGISFWATPVRLVMLHSSFFRQIIQYSRQFPSALASKLGGLCAPNKQKLCCCLSQLGCQLSDLRFPVFNISQTLLSKFLIALTEPNFVMFQFGL